MERNPEKNKDYLIVNKLHAQCLDHGFVTIRNIAGPTRRKLDLFDADDTDPANSARMSFNEMDNERTREDDLKLCNYLMKNWHTSPFEMIVFWIEMKLPIFVARQFVRHRTTSLNEVSARYKTLPAEWYIPRIVGGKAKSVKQGQADNLDTLLQLEFKNDLQQECFLSYQKYLHYIEKGVANEHARMFLHLNHYTHWLWKQDLHNIMHFLALREDSHAQIEPRIYATAMIELFDFHLPKCMELFRKYRTLSSKINPK